MVLTRIKGMLLPLLMVGLLTTGNAQLRGALVGGSLLDKVKDDLVPDDTPKLVDPTLGNKLIGTVGDKIDLVDRATLGNILIDPALKPFLETTILHNFDVGTLKIPTTSLNTFTTIWDGKFTPFPGVSKIPKGPIFSPVSLVFPNVTGEWSATQKVCIAVSQAPVDVYFLADNTGSMGSYIAAVNAAAVAIHGALSSSLTDLRIGVGMYKDWGVDNPGFRNIVPVAGLTAAQFSAAVSQWSASGGGDWPEDQFWALYTLATSPAIGWRSNSIKLVLWFGDAPGHNPAGSVTQGFYTQSQAITALQTKGIKVLALDTAALNYYGQASAVASATSGTYYPSINAGTISSTIVSSIVNAPIKLYPLVTCPANTPLLVQITPPWAIATPQRPACFGVRVRICDEESCFSGRFQCTVRWFDASTNQQVGANYTITGVVLPTTTDHTPPVFIPGSLPPLVYVQCPDKYTLPTVTAIDNCGAAKVNVSAISAVSSPCTANSTAVYTWTAWDAAGNIAKMKQTVVNLDTLPPVITPNCPLQNYCIAASEGGKYCIPYSRWAGCFADRCYGDKLTYKVECANCTQLSETSASPAFVSQCRLEATPPVFTSATSQSICFEVKGWPKERACCNFKVSATDPCGNTAAIYPRVCYYGRGINPPTDCQILPRP